MALKKNASMQSQKYSYLLEDPAFPCKGL